MSRAGAYACVYFKGKRIRLRHWGSPDAKTAYANFVLDLQSSRSSVGNRKRKKDSQNAVLVSELANDFYIQVASKMDKTECAHFKMVIRYLTEVYGGLVANAFSPKKLKRVREQMVKRGTLCRKMINRYIDRIIRIFSWGVVEEVVRPRVVHSLREVRSLRQGAVGTHDNPEREPISDSVVRRTLPFMSPTVRAMVQVRYSWQAVSFPAARSTRMVRRYE